MLAGNEETKPQPRLFNLHTVTASWFAFIAHHKRRGMVMWAEKESAGKVETHRVMCVRCSQRMKATTNRPSFKCEPGPLGGMHMPGQPFQLPKQHAHFLRISGASFWILAVAQVALHGNRTKRYPQAFHRTQAAAATLLGTATKAARTRTAPRQSHSFRWQTAPSAGANRGIRLLATVE